MSELRSPPEARSVAVELPALPSSAARARRAVSALEGAAHPQAIARVRVLVSELVGAFGLHGGEGPIRVSVEAVEGSLRGEVGAPTPHPGSVLRGLARLIVDRLADGWGESSGGRSVWFELEGGSADRRGRRFGERAREDSPR